MNAAMIDPLQHQALVVSIAKRYRHPRVPLEDLISAGQVGLLIACKKYELSRKVKFETYATWWIRSKVAKEALAMKHLIHISDCKKLQQDSIEAEKRASRPHVNEGSLASRSATKPDSIATIAVERHNHVSEVAARIDAAELMRCLSSRQAEVVSMWYGLDGRGERDSSEIAAETGTTKQNAHQIVTKAMFKLRLAANASP